MDVGASVVTDILAHHGVKGQKWGVRKDRGHEGERTKTKKIAKLDKRYEKQASGIHGWIAIHNRAADLTNKHDVERINNKPEYAHENFSRDTPLRRQYYAEHQKAYLDNVQKAAAEYGTNASGTKKLHVTEQEDGNWDVHVVDVQHADDPTGPVRINVKYDATGHIISIEGPDAVAQSAAIVSSILAHHGVKGQKWGVRRMRNATGELVDVQTHKNPIGQVYKTSGGQNHPTHPDAEKAMKVRQKVAGSGTHAVSNKDLQEAINRMNLEQNYARAIESRKGKSKLQKGAEFVKLLLGVSKNTNDTFKNANESLARSQEFRTNVKKLRDTKVDG